MTEPLDTVRGPVRVETVVQRSRFIATLAPVREEADAHAVLDAARREHHDARHHCSAFVLGPHGGLARSSDDGEPSGTAGAPILAVLQGAGLTDVAAVVTRYFGGTLLGAGGLVRAYGGAASEAVAAARRQPRRLVARFEVRVGHEDAGRLEHRMRTHVAAGEGSVAPGRYDADGVRFTVAVPFGASEAFGVLLAESGTPHELRDLGTAIRPVGG